MRGERARRAWRGQRGAGWLALALLAALSGSPAPAAPSEQRDPWAELRNRMVDEQIRSRDVHRRDVLRAMREVPRHLFVPEPQRSQAYDDHPLPIGSGQTISQPYIVALMTTLLDVGPKSKVLEIGTGSGYHAAVLSRVAGEVYTMEIVDDLGRQARQTLERLGYKNVQVRIGDGYKGWPEKAPFDAIVLTAAPPRIPQPLVDQLKPGGRMVLPVGGFWQDLLVVTKQADGSVRTRKVLPVRFVEMTGEVKGRLGLAPTPPVDPVPPGPLRQIP
jgi:protein-L-isoaspartate(D-aspartate) O-methyltransferase